MADEIVVYFNSGNKARLPADRSVFTKDLFVPGLMDMVHDGNLVINWNNVCYVRAFEEKEEDE